jgi:ketosteroid isomerase-like protein
MAQNVELVQELLRRFIETGEPVWESLDEEIEACDHDVVDAGEYKGHSGFARWLENWDVAWAEYSMVPEEFLAAGERVVSIFRMNATGRGSGVQVARQDAMVWEIRDGKVVRLDYYNNRDEALKAAGLPSRG